MTYEAAEAMGRELERMQQLQARLKDVVTEFSAESGLEFGVIALALARLTADVASEAGLTREQFLSYINLVFYECASRVAP